MVSFAIVECLPVVDEQMSVIGSAASERESALTFRITILNYTLYVPAWW